MNTHLNQIYFITRPMNKSTYKKSVDLINSTMNKKRTMLDTEIFNTISLLTIEDNWNNTDPIIKKIKRLASERDEVAKQASFSLLILNAEYTSNVL